MTDRATIDRIKSAKGKRRKEIENALRKACLDWLRGAPGDLLIGELEQRFFADGSVIPCNHNATRDEPAVMTRPGDTIHDC
jgi:hypothetical protein